MKTRSKVNKQSARIRELNRLGISSKDRSLFGELLRKGYDDDFEPTKKCDPTKERPGSIGKMLVLAKRLEDGQELYHELDETMLATAEQQTELVKYVSVHYGNRKWHNGKLQVGNGS